LGWHILAGRGETLSALVKYLSNRAFHSREWRRETAIVEGNETAGDTSERRIPLIFIRKISREGGEDDGPNEVQSRFYCPLLEGGLSTFLCPAEIHSARKCLLKISTSVIVSPFFPSPAYRFFRLAILRWSIFPLDSRLPTKLSRLIRILPHNLALIKPIRNYRN